MYVGWSCSLGLCLVGNFQLHTDRTLQRSEPLSREELIVQKIHWLGAFLTFIGGIVWMSGQTLISLGLAIGTEKGQWKRRTAGLRLLITLLSFVFVVTGIVTALFSAMQTDNGKGPLLLLFLAFFTSLSK